MPGLMGAFTSKLKRGADILNFLANKKDDNSSRNDPDEKWSNLYREKQRNHLYKWVDTEKGGELLEVYDKEGEEGVIRFTNEKITPMLYNDGTLLEKIRLNDYIKWKKALDANLNGGNEDNESNELLEDITKNWTDHTAQWRLNKRGIDGETILHLLLSRDEAKCTEIVKILIKLFPGLAMDIYEGNEFYGQSLLHLAIVHDDYDCVSALLDAGADINRRATGRFFIPEDQKRTQKPKTNYAGFAYYGEYPLAFAASFGNKDIYDFLIQHGADPNAQDSFGNTVLHICVINNSIEMYSYAVRHWAKPADVNLCNHAGYTPLTLATILGRREIFDAMLELTKVEFWRFSDMACSAYPLTTLDTIRPDGSTNWDSALMRVVSGARTDHLDIVGSEVIQRLLADKWRSFGHRKMYQRLILLILHLLILSVAIYIRPPNAEDLWGRDKIGDLVRYAIELALLLSCLVFLFYQQGSEINAQGFQGYLRTLISAPEKTLFLISNILLLLCVPCRLTDQYTAEEMLLVLALPASWTYLLFFAKAYLLTGPFVIMIYQMIKGDMVRFAAISLVFLVSFSQAFFFLGKDMRERQIAGGWCDVPVDDHEIVDYDTYWETAMTLFRMSMGGYDYEEFDCASYKPLTKLLFVIYMIIMPIMLINMLIAMMGNTYTTIISQAQKAWRQQWAQLVILLERALDRKKLSKYQTAYSIKLSDDRFDQDDQGPMEVRALMVIKQTKKTRAKQRKQATASWKRISRKVIGLLRSHTTEKVQENLHSQSYRPFKRFSRPGSSTGHFLPIQVTQSLKPAVVNVERKSSITGGVPGDHSILINHVVESMRNSPVPPPITSTVDRASPQVFVHQADAQSRGSTPRYNSTSLMAPEKRQHFGNQLSVEKLSSLDLPAMPSTRNLTQSSIPKVTPLPLSKLQTQEMDPKTEDIVSVSSPHTPNTSTSTTPAHQGANKQTQFQDLKAAEPLRRASFQLQPLSVETLPLRRNRPVPKLRKNVSNKSLILTSMPQTIELMQKSDLASSEPGLSTIGDDHQAVTVSPFLRRTTGQQLPNMPQPTNTPGGDEETISFHDDILDTSMTQPKSPVSTISKRKSPSPPIKSKEKVKTKKLFEQSKKMKRK